MHPRQMPAGNESQDLCSLAMDRAIGIERTSLAPTVGLNGSLNDVYKNAFWLVPAFGNLLGTATSVFAVCMELQLNWLAMMVPHANGESEATVHVAAGSSTVVSSSAEQALPTIGSERSMDIAIGARAGQS